jgi:hypothetical protein
MRIAYVNTDEVNQDLAERTASEYCAAVCILVPEGPPPDGLFDAVLYNLDDVPRDQQPAFLEELCLGTTDCPTAVHGYGIADEQAQALRRHGVAVAQRLHPALLRSLCTAGLCKAARRSRATVPSDGALTDLTWVNLAK